MITWKNLDTLASFKELKETKEVNLADVMSGDNGAERVKNYSVPMAEGMAYNYAAKKVDDKTMQVIYQDIEEKLKQKLGRKVIVTSKGEGSGKIEIEFYNHEDLDRLLDVLNK